MVVEGQQVQLGVMTSSAGRELGVALDRQLFFCTPSLATLTLSLP